MSKAVEHFDSSAPDALDPAVDVGDPQPLLADSGTISLPSIQQDSDGESQNAGAADMVPATKSGWRQLLLNRGDQAFVAVAVSVMLVLMLVHWLRLSGWGLEPVEIDRLEPLEHTFRVDINRATWVEWSQLEGVGQVLARKIVADRDAHGPFRSIDDVQRVKGIGRKKLEQLRPWLTIDPSTVSK